MIEKICGREMRKKYTVILFNTKRKFKLAVQTAIVLTAIFVGILPMHAYADVPKGQWPEGPQLSSPCAVVMEVNTGTVLYEKNAHEVHYPASITKILTTYLAIENCDMDETVTFSADAVFKNEGDTSHISRDLGEQMTMEQTLYAVMLESANECAYAAAEHVGEKLGGDYSTFIDLMNKKAEELGCRDTHFNNANGLPDENHWTSAYDMGLIGCAAYKNDEFRKITGTKSYMIPPTNKHVEETPLNNHHGILHKYRSVTGYVNPYCTGGKTGYTTVANSTLVTFAEKDGISLCVVVMNATSPNHWEDTNTLINYCFSNFKAIDTAANEADMMQTENKSRGVLNEHDMFVKLSENYIILPNTAEFSDVVREQQEKANKDSLATIVYKYADREVGRVELLKSGESVDLSYYDSGKDKNGDIIRIKPVYILVLLLMIAALVLLLYLGRKASENFYLVKHKWEVKREQRKRFMEHKQKRRRRRKKDNLSFRDRK